MAIKKLKISVSGVRGVVGEALTPALASSFAAAFGEYVGKGRVIVGKDTRLTGDMYEKSVIAGLLSVGCQPVLIGVVPTPTVQIMVKNLNATGGIAITASHNPIEWNALKLIGGGGLFLNYNEALELLDVYNQPARAYVAESEYRNIRTLDNAFAIHEARVLDNVDVKLIKEAKLKVVVDCCNGAGAPYAQSFLEKLGCEVIPIFDEIDGTFHRRPEPIAENLTKLSETVVAQKADIGFALDPDADRIVVVGADGVAIGEQNSIVLVTEHLLSQSKGEGKVVVNIQTTKSVGDIAAKYGCECHYTPVGEINVTQQILKHGAIIGGEGGSGGIIFPKVHPGRDSFTGMALILEMMAMRKQTLAEIMTTIPTYENRGFKIPCSGEKAQRLIRHLSKKYEELSPDTIDGLRINFETSWILIRSSNTEPIIRLYVEATTIKERNALSERFLDEINAFNSK
ncbi:MAG: phosphoglucosamine mutase [Lentisphaeria bacterium]|nr:phosphoglucosamine mutase [Lentisphaeria bacterium]